jgi:hypothetical protein
MKGIRKLQRVRLKWAMAWTGLFLVLTAAIAEADTTPHAGDGVCIVGGEGGHDVPTPFQIYNQTVELADRVSYLLYGKVVFAADLPFFEVDLSAHRWLANPQRRDLPLYPLEGLAAYWRRFENAHVRLSVVAHARPNITLEVKDPKDLVSVPGTDSPAPAASPR